MAKITVIANEVNEKYEFVRLAAILDLVGDEEFASGEVMIQDDSDDSPEQQIKDYAEYWQVIANRNGMEFENAIGSIEFDKVFRS